MCGIVGVVSTSQVDPNVVLRMRDRLVHRGPDHGGIWHSEDKRVCLGHRRLAILDLSPQAAQPFVSHDGRFVLTYNGEIYNYRELRRQLEGRNVRFRTASDTEVLLEAFRFWGEGCLAELSGMFAFAIWDVQQRQLFCARDRVGEKPFYYAFLGDSFVFASEVKSLMVWPPFTARINYTSLIDYLSFGCIVDPKCIWEGCHKIPAGHMLTVQINDDMRLRLGEPRSYWDFEFDPDYREQNWAARIRETLAHASNEMAVSDVPLGTFLSGGVDSSSVTAALSRAGRAVNTFTVGFCEDAFDERPWARGVSEQYGTVHTERVVVPDDVTEAYDTLLWHYDEPFNDYSFVPTYYLCREAKQGITVALSGDGADELFAGYVKYQRLGLRAALNRRLPTRVSRLLATMAMQVCTWSGRARQRILPHTMSDSDLITDIVTNCFAYSDLRTSARGPLAEALKHYNPTDTIRGILRKAPPKEVGPVNAMRFLDLKLTLSGDILVKVDRASMAVSLEVRPVFLHRDMLELARQIPAHELATGKCSKKVLKSAVRPWLSDALIDRRKQGFAMPLHKWINGELTEQFNGKGKEVEVEHLLDTQRLAEQILSRSGNEEASPLALHSLFHLKHWLHKWNEGARGTS